MALKRVWIPSPNYSSRGNASVRLIVVHTAEGALTYQSLGSFFGRSSSGVSSHVGIDDTSTTVGEYVSRSNKAWTQGNANPVAVSAELCAFAAWSKDEWFNHPMMLSNCAEWLLEESIAFNIPLVRLTSSQAQGSGRGVCEHVDLGSWGGGHVDCGPNFPLDDIIDMASGTLEKPSKPKDWPLPFIKENNGDVYWFIADGKKSYWRLVPKGLVQNIPEGMIIDDPNGSWLDLWNH